jgi:hypothetical protein
MSSATVDTLRPSHAEHEHRIEHFTLEELTVDSAVQRSVDQKWVNDRTDKTDEDGKVIKRRFKPEALGVIVVSRRRNGTIHIIDGQHRATLCRQMNYTEPMACLVYSGLCQADEAAMFRVLNDRRKVNVIDLFRVRVVEGDPVATELSDVLDKEGWIVQPNKTQGSFAAVSALEKVYKGWGPTETANRGACETLMSVITKAWGLDPHGARAEIITGLGLLLTYHGNKVDVGKLVTELGRISGGPRVLCGRASSLKEMRGGRIGDSMAEILINLINKGKTRNRLPAWSENG